MGNTTLKKNAKGYGYKYTDIAEINTSLEEMGITYYQYTDRVGDDDYIYTVPVIEGKEQQPRRGCRIVIPEFDKKSNPAQEQGSGITYARRYSLLMAFGLATADDDAECITREKPKKVEKVEAEVVKETPKEKKEKEMIPGYPDKEEMIKIILKHYPDGSENQKRLLENAKVGSIEEMTEAQMAAVYNKFGGR